MGTGINKTNTDINEETRTTLIEAAINARELAYAPYSHFKVGAALLACDGTIYSGCNIENAAFTPGICAERAAFAKAVSCGARGFTSIAVAGWADLGRRRYSFPCGVCRQVMREFVTPEDFIVITAISTKEFCVKTLEELLPNSFGPEDLK